MRCSLRFKVLAGIVLFVGLVILTLVLEDKCETYDPLGYIQASIPWMQVEAVQPFPLGGRVEDKIIVVPSLEDEDVTWVTDELPDWQHAIYTVNPSSDEMRAHTLTTPVNKGHEAMAYLTYIIDHYARSIPSVVAFLHSHRGGFFTAWHVDTPLHDNVYAMRHLQLDYVKDQGYVNLRCNLNPGCKRTSGMNRHVSMADWQEVLGNTSTPAFSQHGPSAAVEAHAASDDSATVPPRIWTPCCAQFAVSREQILKRPLQDYIQIREWLMTTDRDDAQSGRVLEYLWHVIFGQQAIHCPDVDICYCKVYGRC